MKRPRAWVSLLGIMGLLTMAGASAPDRPASAEELREQLASERDQAARKAAAYRREIRRARHRAERLASVFGVRRTVSEALTLASLVYNVARSELERVAACESTYRPTASNGQYLGLFQLGAGFRSRSPFFAVAGLSPFSPYANALAAARVVAHEGWSQWECRP